MGEMMGETVWFRFFLSCGSDFQRAKSNSRSNFATGCGPFVATLYGFP